MEPKLRFRIREQASKQIKKFIQLRVEKVSEIRRIVLLYKKANLK